MPACWSGWAVEASRWVGCKLVWGLGGFPGWGGHGGMLGLLGLMCRPRPGCLPRQPLLPRSQPTAYSCPAPLPIEAVQCPRARPGGAHLPPADATRRQQQQQGGRRACRGRGRSAGWGSGRSGATLRSGPGGLCQPGGHAAACVVPHDPGPLCGQAAGDAGAGRLSAGRLPGAGWRQHCVGVLRWRLRNRLPWGPGGESLMFICVYLYCMSASTNLPCICNTLHLLEGGVTGKAARGLRNRRRPCRCSAQRQY